MKKLAAFIVCLLLFCSIVDARAPLESYKRYMFVLVHGVGANTMKPHDYVADPEHWESADVPRKSSIWDESRDDDFGPIPLGNWFGDVGGSLQSRGFLGHVVWYDFYQPWKGPILGDGRYGTSLSQYLGDRSVTDNPMGMNGFGKTAQTFWLHNFFPDILKKHADVTYENGGKGSFLQLAQEDWKTWNEVQKYVGLNNEEIPKKYILIAHSMGGLTTRDYITGDFYKGDVDKLITLDSPHEGSAIANYVQYWKTASEKTGKVAFSFVALEADAVAVLLSAAGMQYMLSTPVTALSEIPTIMGLCAGFFAPFMLSQIESSIGQYLSGYEEVEDGDHTAFGIDVMALNDENKYGLYQSDTKQFLKDFNDRAGVGGKKENGYSLPYFRLVSTSGVPTPGGHGFHKGVNTLGTSFVSKVFGGLVPHNFIGESGSIITGATSFDIIFKTLVALGTNSLWNDWGSGFVPHWSSEGKNVKIFNDAKADTKRWNIAFDNTNEDESTLGFAPLLLGIGAMESVAQAVPYENPVLKWIRFVGYLSVVAAYMYVADGHELAHLPSFVGFHGAMVKRVDEDKVGVKTRGGVEKKLLDELLWEKPSVSIVYNPVDPQDRSNSQGGEVGISTTKELVKFSSADVVGSYVDVIWQNETEPHIFELSLDGAFDEDEEKRLKTINIVDWFKNTVVTEVELSKVGEDKTLVCSVVKNSNGRSTCEIPMSDKDKGNYTMKLKVQNADKAGVIYGVMVDVGRAPGATFVSGDALFDAQDGDWEQYITFKNRRKQIGNDGKIDVDVADMVDYRRTSNLVVNKLPRMFEFEVDDLQPDRMNKLTVDFNYGSAKIEYEAVKDPNKFEIAYTGEGISLDAVKHGFVNTAAEQYKMKVSIGSQNCETKIDNPVDAWGKWVVDLDDIQKTLKDVTGCSIKNFQPFLEGQNHIRVFSENRWEMSRAQNLNMFIPGPPPTISLVYPRNGEVFCGKTKLEFETNLIYALSSDLTNDDISVYYMDGDKKITIPSSELTVTPKKNSSSITAYNVVTNNEIAWPKETAISITIKPKILDVGATPFTYLLKIAQDCVAPTVVIDADQNKYNPTTISFESYDLNDLSGKKNSIADEIIELSTKDGKTNYVLSASKFVAPGEKVRTIELNDASGNKLPDGKYYLSARVHDGMVKDLDSDNKRRDFWESYKPNPDMTIPFASYCNDGKLDNNSICMTHWAKDSIEIIIDNTAPVVDSSKFVLKKDDKEFDLEQVRYAGDATDKNLVLKMTVSDDNFDTNNMPEASIEFTQVDLIGSVLEGGHHMVQQLVGEYKDGKVEYNHDVIKALTEDLKNQMNGYQPFPDGVYYPVVKIKDAAKNVTVHPLPVIFVDMTAPVVTEVNVPYTVKSGMMHVVTFKVDESKDDLSLAKLGDVRATVNALCGDKSIPYGPVSSSGIYPQIKFAFEAQIPQDVSGSCVARIQTYDINNNVRYAELSFIVDFIPPEITYPEKAKDGDPAELYGRVVIRGSAGNPNLRKGGSFTRYELTYAEVDIDGSIKGDWKRVGMSVPESRRCNNLLNVSCSVVEKGARDILGYWDLSMLPDEAKGRTYRIKVETFNEGGFSESDFVDVFVPTATKTMPSITIADIPSNECDFEDEGSNCNIRWNTDFPLEQKNGQIRMEILRKNANDQVILVDVERIFNNVIPKEFYGAPHDASAKGVYLWIDRNDLNKDENIYHLRLTAGAFATQYTILFAKSKEAKVKINSDDDSEMDLSQSLSDMYSSLNVNLNAGESRSYIVKCDAKSRLAWSLQSSVVKTGGNVDNMKFLFSGNNEDEDLAFIGENAIPVISKLHQGEVHLPQTSSIDQFVWDGKNDALASVPSGDYRIILTLEGLEDGVYAVAQKDITVIGKPVVLGNVDAIPKQVPFDVSYMENNVLKPVHVTFSFNIDQDANVSAYVRAVGDGRAPKCEYMKIKIDGGSPAELNKYYLAGRKDNYLINWDGHHGGSEQANVGDYEFVVQIHDSDGNVVDSNKVAFSITDEQMVVDGESKLFVDGKNEKHEIMENRDYQIVEGMNDAVLQFAPAGKTVVTDNVLVKARFKGEQLANAMPFERYSIGVQIHRTKAEFWVFGAMSYAYNKEQWNKVLGIPVPVVEDVERYSNRIHFYGEKEPVPVTFVEGGPEIDIQMNFDSGEAGSDKENQMRWANVTLFFIPTYMMTASEIKKMIESGSFNEKYEKVKNAAVAEIRWGGSSNSIEVKECHDNTSLCPNGIKTYFVNKKSSAGDAIVKADDIYLQYVPSPSFNSMSIYWDKRCDVGPAIHTCMAEDVSKEKCKELGDESDKCGNGIADEGEPLLGSAEKYNSLKHSAEFEAKVWGLRFGKFDPFGPVGEDDVLHQIRLIARVKPTDRFWGKTVDPVSGETKIIGYGNGNIVNRYLTLDPSNENFLFCDACDFSSNKTPFLNPSVPQRYELTNKDGTFISTLYNKAFYKYHEVDGENEIDASLQDDVQLIFHYFEIIPNNEIYAGNSFHLDATVSQGDRYHPFALWTFTDYVQGEFFKTPIPLAGLGGVGLSIDVDISMPWSESFDLTKNQITVPWPLKDVSMVLPTCGANGCGSKIDDKMPFLSPNAIETEDVVCNEKLECYKEFKKSVDLGPQGSDYSIPYLDNGYDLRSDLINWRTSITNKNPLISSVDPVEIFVPGGYKYNGGVVRKDDVGCDENGCDYIAGNDPLISEADLDGDSIISEDGSSVTLTKDKPYESSLDVDRDLAMGEDPADAFRVRLPSMTFNFEAGASSQSNLLEYSLGELMGSKLSELQQPYRDKGKRPPTVADDNSVLQQKSDLSWTDNPMAKTQWESSNNPAFFERTKLFYKDGKVNDDVKIVKSENMDNHNAMSGKIWIGPNDFDGRDRRLLEVRAMIPNMQENETYKLYASSELGWIDLTPSTTVKPKSGKIDGLIAYWDVETSGMHQLMLVRTVDGERKYKTVDVFVGAVANDEKTLFSDAMGRSQVQVASGTKYIDVIPLGKNEVPQTIPSNKNLGPVVKIYPSISTIDEEISLRLRFNKNEVNGLGWLNNGSMYVVSDGCSPQRVDGVSWKYYNEENKEVSSGSNWSYVIVSGIVPNVKKQQKEQTSVKMGEAATFNGATVSVTESSNGLYNVNFNPDVNP